MTGFRTPVALAGGVCGILMFIAALFLGRADVAVTGAVLLCATAMVWTRVPAGPPQVTVERETGARDRAVRVRVDVVAEDAELVHLDMTALGADRHRLAVAGSTAVRVDVPAVHSGIHDLVEATGESAAADGTWVSVPSARAVARVVSDPAVREVPFLPVPRTLTGLTGAHEAVRAGDGGEFLEIRPFAPGDRLRRIDWKATARVARRPGELYVRRTFATSDADVAVIIDDGDDLAGVLGDWFAADPRLDAPRSLDVTREAAWSLASGYLDAGDQVSLHLLSRAGGTVPRGSGIRQRERLRAAIVALEAGRRLTRERTPRLVPGALIIVLSVFLDDDMVDLVELWRASGHRVLAVDTLPRLRTERLTPEMVSASRIVLGERADRLRTVTAAGADVLVWDADPAERAAALRGFARARRRR